MVAWPLPYHLLSTLLPLASTHRTSLHIGQPQPTSKHCARHALALTAAASGTLAYDSLCLPRLMALPSPLAHVWMLHRPLGIVTTPFCPETELRTWVAVPAVPACVCQNLSYAFVFVSCKGIALQPLLLLSLHSYWQPSSQYRASHMHSHIGYAASGVKAVRTWARSVT